MNKQKSGVTQNVKINNVFTSHIMFTYKSLIRRLVFSIYQNDRSTQHLKSDKAPGSETVPSELITSVDQF